MDRRSFIKNTSLGLGAVGHLKIGDLQVSPFNSLYNVHQENDNILIVIQLFGGNDGINTITPHELPDYYNRFRPKLHIPQNAAIPFGDKAAGLAMHPALKSGIKEGMYGLFKSGKLAVIQGVGYRNPNLSHFRSTDIWFSGIVPANDGELLPTGWLGRYFDQYENKELPESPYCIHVGESPLLMFQGQNEENAILLEDPDELFNQANKVESDRIDLALTNLFSEEFDYINDIGIKINHFSKSIKEAFDKGKNVETYESDRLSKQLKLVARLIDGGLKTKVFSVGLNGFDTHADQGVLDGAHGGLLRILSTALASFQSDIEKLGFSKKVIGITVSEFGRRPYENASMGTDHGTANVMFAFGEEVKGEVFGGNIVQLPFLDSENLAFKYDFRSVYQEILRTWFGASSLFSETVLGGKFSYIDKVGFLRSTEPDYSLPDEPELPDTSYDPRSPDNPNNPYNITEQDHFVLFPNPTADGKVNLAMTLYIANYVEIHQYGLQGRYLGQIAPKTFYREGTYLTNLQIEGSHGLYILHIIVANRNHYLKVIKM